MVFRVPFELLDAEIYEKLWRGEKKCGRQRTTHGHETRITSSSIHNYLVTAHFGPNWNEPNNADKIYAPAQPNISRWFNSHPLWLIPFYALQLFIHGKRAAQFVLAARTFNNQEKLNQSTKAMSHVWMFAGAMLGERVGRSHARTHNARNSNGDECSRLIHAPTLPTTLRQGIARCSIRKFPNE